MDELVIAVAPVGPIPDGRGRWTPRRVADEVVAAWKAGASVAHLHVRDEDGEPTSDATAFRQTIDLIRRECDIVIEGSTGGPRTWSFSERSSALDCPVEMGSLNMGSVNFIDDDVYINLPGEIREWAAIMAKRRIKPDCCVFDLSMLEMVRRLGEEELLVGPPFVGLCLGFPNALGADAQTLYRLAGLLPPQAIWTLVHHQAPDFRVQAAAIAAGGNVRVGFEDSCYMPNGQVARSNAELVSATVDLAAQLGRHPAKPELVRELLGVRPAAGLSAVRRQAARMIRSAGIHLVDTEIEKIEVTDFGLGDLAVEGGQILTFVNTERVAAKVIALFPHQVLPEHWHPPIKGTPGKEETIRVVAGTLYMHTPGESDGSVLPIPAGKEAYYTARRQTVMRPGDTLTILPGTKHWFAAGRCGAVVYSFSSAAVDVLDEFTDPAVVR